MSASANESRFQPGQMLLDKYRVDHVLGVGGMGAVIAATHVQLDQKVAMKFVHPEIAVHPEAVQRFIREARAAAQIRSEHVVRVSDVGALGDGSPYMVMEYLEGEDLEGALSRGVPQPEVVVDYLLQACTGLLEAHQHGIVHRDLKPANLFLTRKRDGRVTVKVLDFGISKVQKPGDSAVTQTSSLMGSPLYMSPEQMTRPKEVDARADIWAMGVIAYEALTGQRPFNGEALPEVCGQILALNPPQVSSLRPEVPAKLSAVVHKCLEKEPSLRFQDVTQLMDALEPFAPVSQNARQRLSSLPSESVKPPVEKLSDSQRTQQAWAETAGVGTQLAITPEKPKSKAPLFIGLGAAAVLGVVALLALRSGASSDEPATAALVPEAPTAAPKAPEAPAPTPEAAPTPPAPAPTTAAAAPSAATPAAAPVTAAGRPATQKKPATTTAAPAPVAAAPVEAPKPAAAPVEAPAPKPAAPKPKKNNPLDIDIK